MSHELKVFRFIDVKVLKWSVSWGRRSMCRRDGKDPWVFCRERISRYLWETEY